MLIKLVSLIKYAEKLRLLPNSKIHFHSYSHRQKNSHPFKLITSLFVNKKDSSIAV